MILIFRSQRTLIRFQKFLRWQFALAAAQKRVSNNYRWIVNTFLSPPCKCTDLPPLCGRIFTELFAIKINNRGKNIWPNSRIPVTDSPRPSSNLRNPPFPRSVRSLTPSRCRRKIGCRIRAQSSLRVHFYGCVEKGREASSNEQTLMRRTSRRTKKTLD